MSIYKKNDVNLAFCERSRTQPNRARKVPLPHPYRTPGCLTALLFLSFCVYTYMCYVHVIHYFSLIGQKSPGCEQEKGNGTLAHGSCLLKHLVLWDALNGKPCGPELNMIKADYRCFKCQGGMEPKCVELWIRWTWQAGEETAAFSCFPGARPLIGQQLKCRGGQCWDGGENGTVKFMRFRRDCRDT